ncbi:hypothetical protein BDW42DRAFT_181852 [Aspergillus taichungensis]|uniref:BZIP domain-containing protein n=1 Tax=Aspergillus taichungensis TaxID=482145 RepID=A0A2J5HDC8_9EURO|nr:hypothetical protein BDW42DRAFT_181852 [Aspergillus taichungensis]
MKQKPQPSAGASSLPSPPTTPTRSPASIAKDNTNRQRSRSTPRRGRNSASNPPLSPEEAHERLLERNRQAATKCREKRKKEFEALSAYVAQLERRGAEASCLRRSHSRCISALSGQ